MQLTVEEPKRKKKKTLQEELETWCKTGFLSELSVDASANASANPDAALPAGEEDEEDENAPVFLFPSDFGGEHDIFSLIDLIKAEEDAKVLFHGSHGGVYKHGGKTLVDKYVYWEGKGARVNLITPMLDMLKLGYCLRLWKPAEQNKKWYLWIVCDAVTLLPIDSAPLLSAIEKYPESHFLLAAWNSDARKDGKTKTYAMRYVQMNGVVINMDRAPFGWADIFGVSPSGPAPVCKRGGCNNAVPPINSIYWHTICRACKRKEDNVHRAAARLTAEGQAKQFAVNANKEDKKKGVSPRYSTKEFFTYLLPLLVAFRARFGEDTEPSKERLNVSRDPDNNSYTQNAKDGTLIPVPYRFNIAGQSTYEHSSNGETSKTWSFPFFLLCSCAQAISKMEESEKEMHDISSLFNPLSVKEYKSAKLSAMGRMTFSAKNREDGSRDAIVFDDLHRKYGYVDTVSGFLQLTYQLDKSGGTARMSPYVAIETMIKEKAALVFGAGSVNFGSPIHQLTKFSPDRIDNNDKKYTITNTVSIACAFQTVEPRTFDPVLEAKKNDQKWQPSVFAATDFCLMSKVYRFIPDEEAQMPKYASLVESILVGLRQMVAAKKHEAGEVLASEV